MPAAQQPHQQVADLRLVFDHQRLADPGRRRRWRDDLAPLVADDVDTLVLGCTHYPLLKSVIGEIVGRQVRLIDSAEETALDTQRMLAENELQTTRDAGTYRFIASDDPQQFLRLGQRFFGDALDDVEVRTFG